MKQRVNFLDLYQKSQPADYAKYMVAIWLAACFVLCIWNWVVWQKVWLAEDSIEGLKVANQTQAMQLEKESNQFLKENGRTVTEKLNSLTSQIKQKEALLENVKNLQYKHNDLTYYLSKVAKDYVEGTLIDTIYIHKGQMIKVTGRSLNPRLVPRVLASWEHVELNERKNTSQLKIMKLKNNSDHVKFVIQVE